MKLVQYLFFPVISIYTLAYWFSKCERILKLSVEKTFLLALFFEIACAICAIAMSVVEAGFQIQNATTYRLYGLMFFMPLFCVLFAKIRGIDKSSLFDVLAVAVMLRLIIGRIDCFFGGCCRGILLPGSAHLRWPIRELEICYYVVLVFVSVKKMPAKNFRGKCYPIYLTTYGIFRFVVEWVREEYVGQIGIFHTAHLWSLLAIAGGGITIYLIDKHHEEHKTHSKHS